MVEIEVNSNSAMYMGVPFSFFKLRLDPKIEELKFLLVYFIYSLNGKDLSVVKWLR